MIKEEKDSKVNVTSEYYGVDDFGDGAYVIRLLPACEERIINDFKLLGIDLEGFLEGAAGAASVIIDAVEKHLRELNNKESS